MRSVLRLTGIGMLLVVGAMLIPLCIDMAQSQLSVAAFLKSQAIGGFLGVLLVTSAGKTTTPWHVKDSFVALTLSFLGASIIASLPLVLTGSVQSLSQGIFESVAALTTTNATIIPNPDSLSRGLQLWRCLLGWIGGAGFLLAAATIFPMLSISGMHIFNPLSSETHTIQIRMGHTSAWVFMIYLALTAILFIVLKQENMTGFEAFCYALSTISLSGFSIHDQSINFYNSPLIESTLIVFMLMAGLPYHLYLRLSKRDFMSIMNDQQVRGYLTLITFFIIIMSAYLMITERFYFEDALRHSAFKVVSLITTTGFTTQDYELWGPFAAAVAFIITFIGGCSGSPAGGIKIFRLQILWSTLKLHIKKIATPKGMFFAQYNSRALDLETQNEVACFFFVYITIFLVAGALLMMAGLDFVTAFSGALTSLSNLGLGLGGIIGPSGDFSTLPSQALWVLSTCMILGRFEIFAVLVLLAPRFWQR